MDMAKKKTSSTKLGIAVSYRTCDTPESLFHSAQAVLEVLTKRGDLLAYHRALVMIEYSNNNSHRVADLPADKNTIGRLVCHLYDKVNAAATLPDGSKLRASNLCGYEPLEYDPHDEPLQAVQEFQNWCLRQMDEGTRERLVGSCGNPTNTRKDVTYSPGFRSVNWFGRELAPFTPKQGEAFGRLYECFEEGHPDIDTDYIMADDNSAPNKSSKEQKKRGNNSSAKRLRRLFKGHEVWGTVIVSSKKRGLYRLKRP